MPSTVNRPIPPEAAKKYATRYAVDENGCWVSTYAITKSGYVFSAWRENGHSVGSTAHRAAYTHHNGPIPDDMTVHHECFNRACVNPDHLALLSNVDNSRRQRGSDFPVGQCAYGHPDSMRKLYGKKKPVWRCGECMRLHNVQVTEARLARQSAALITQK